MSGVTFSGAEAIRCWALTCTSDIALSFHVLLWCCFMHTEMPYEDLISGSPQSEIGGESMRVLQSSHRARLMLRLSEGHPAGTPVTSTRFWCADAQRCHRGTMGTLTRSHASSAGAHGRSALADTCPFLQHLAECMPCSQECGTVPGLSSHDQGRTSHEDF